MHAAAAWGRHHRGNSWLAVVTASVNKLSLRVSNIRVNLYSFVTLADESRQYLSHEYCNLPRKLLRRSKTMRAVYLASILTSN